MTNAFKSEDPECDNSSLPKNLSRSEQVHRYVRDAIRTGAIKPGERLREADLVQTLGLSRTPVREAITRLESEGLVVNHPTLGLTVPELDYSEVTELYFMRELLEGAAARLAAHHASDVEISILEDLGEQYKTAATEEELILKNKQFHDTLCHCAHNRYLIKVINQLQNSLSLLGKSSLTEADRVAETIEEHQNIVNAIRERDPARAEKAVQQHIRSAQKRRMTRLFAT
ncbi:MAG: GntR family transcriptional regulator [Alcaligenaceae bacterium]|nr:GntR family transcriptional regulator [Alcaligenaceae bacterium]